MRRYPYIRCSGDKKRICLLCDAPYLARNPEEVNTFCPGCSSKTRKRELRIVTANLKRAERAETPATLTIKQWLRILDHFNWCCAYCSGPYDVIEHIVSIRAGGGTTAFNCVPSCVPCNTHKDRISTSSVIISTEKIEYVQFQLEEISHDTRGAIVMVADKDKIEQCVLDMARANGSVAVQTLTFMMGKYLQTETEPTVRSAQQHLTMIANAAHIIAEDPDLWTYQERYSEALFDRHFLRGQDILLDFYIDLGRVILKLDSTYGKRFNVSSAQNYLRDVEECAVMLRQDLEDL